MKNLILQSHEDWGSAISDIAGTTTLVGAVTLNIYEMISGVSLNSWFVLATSVGGLVFLGFKIATQVKALKLKKLEIKKEELLIKKLEKRKR